MHCYVCGKPATFTCPICLRCGCNEHYMNVHSTLNRKKMIGCIGCVEVILREEIEADNKFSCAVCGAQGKLASQLLKCGYQDCSNWLCPNHSNRSGYCCEEHHNKQSLIDAW